MGVTRDLEASFNGEMVYIYMYYVGGNEKGIALAKIPYGELHEHAALGSPSARKSELKK